MKIRIIKKNKIGKEAREVFYKQFLGEQLNDEKEFAKKLRPLFDIQEKEVIENLKETLKHIPYSMVNTKTVDEMLFDKDKQVRAFVMFEKPIIYNVVKKSAKRIEDLGVPIEVDIFEERVEKYVSERSLTFAKNVNDTTLDRLRKTLTDGVNEGESIFELTERIGDVYESARGPRAEMIARTEVGSAMNYGHWEAYQGSRAIKEQEWVATYDGRVRADHLAADGQIVKKDEKFIVGGEALSYPNDPLGSPENTINCRCTTIPVIK